MLYSGLLDGFCADDWGWRANHVYIVIFSHTIAAEDLWLHHHHPNILIQISQPSREFWPIHIWSWPRPVLKANLWGPYLPWGDCSWDWHTLITLFNSAPERSRRSVLLDAYTQLFFWNRIDRWLYDVVCILHIFLCWFSLVPLFVSGTHRTTSPTCDLEDGSTFVGFACKYENWILPNPMLSIFIINFHHISMF